MFWLVQSKNKNNKEIVAKFVAHVLCKTSIGGPFINLYMMFAIIVTLEL